MWILFTMHKFKSFQRIQSRYGFDGLVLF